VFELVGVPGAEEGDVLAADGEVEREVVFFEGVGDGGVGGHEEVEALAGGAAGFADLDIEVFFSALAVWRAAVLLVRASTSGV
jgi:hypothetical protein